MTSIKDLLISGALSFSGALLTCLSQHHGFDLTCVWDSLGVIGTGMVTYHIGLQMSAPGKVQLPVDFAERVQK